MEKVSNDDDDKTDEYGDWISLLCYRDFHHLCHHKECHCPCHKQERPNETHETLSTRKIPGGGD